MPTDVTVHGRLFVESHSLGRQIMRAILSPLPRRQSTRRKTPATYNVNARFNEIEGKGSKKKSPGKKKSPRRRTSSVAKEITPLKNVARMASPINDDSSESEEGTQSTRNTHHPSHTSYRKGKLASQDCLVTQEGRRCAFIICCGLRNPSSVCRAACSVAESQGRC